MVPHLLASTSTILLKDSAIVVSELQLLKIVSVKMNDSLLIP